MKLHFLAVIAVSCGLKGIIVGQLEIPPEDVSVFHGESGTINCTVQAGNQVLWSDVSTSPSVQIFFGEVGTNIIQRGPNAGDGTKYENFDIESPEGSTQFNLKINKAQFSEDEGHYDCSVFGQDAGRAQLWISVLPPLVEISCTPMDCSRMDGKVFQNDVICNCSAIGVFPGTIEIMWEGVVGSPRTDRTLSTTGFNGTYDLRSEAVVQQVVGAERVSCSLSGYAKDPGSRVKSVVLVSPTCNLQGPLDMFCLGAIFTCNVKNEPYPEDLSFQFYFENGTQIHSGQESEITLNIETGSTIDLYCTVCNSFGSHKSEVVSFTCHSAASTFVPTTPDSKTGDDRTQPSALIAICCVEGVVIIAMMCLFVFLYTVMKGSRKEDAQSLGTHHQDSTEKTNAAYMDLQETRRLPSNHVNVDVPFEKLNLQAPFPGKGLMKYRKAQITLTSKMEEIVVKTVSDDAPVRLAKLQADEVRKLATLAWNENVAQFLGRCNNVPNLLCYEFVNGTKLGDYLRENFQPSKIHQYGNTKQKRFHVPEKGSVETLPRVALQIARGMKYLTTLKFLHPGLRSEKVIIDVSGQCKLYDFVSNDNAKDIVAILWDKSVPYQWMPPEYLFLEKLGPLVDVWSFGVLMWEIFSYGALPYEGKGRSDVEKELRGKKNLPLPNNCPGAIWQITLNCWEQSPEKRPSFDHLFLQLSHMCNDNKEYAEVQSK